MVSGGPVNPYAAPEADPVDEVTHGVLEGVAIGASRGARLGAALLDSLVVMAVLIPLQYGFGVFANFPKMKLTPTQSVLWASVGFAVWLAIHGYFLLKTSQTLGKRLVGIQIVKVSNLEPASFRTLVLWRSLPVQVISLIPMVGAVLSLVDCLLIFRKDRRCAHDYLAGTRVIVKPLG